MRNKPLMFVLAGAVIFGLIAALSVSNYLTGQKNGQNRIVVAKMEIPLGQKITADHLTSVQMPADAVPEGAFATPDTLIGRVAATRVAAREAVTIARLAPEGAMAGLSGLIPEGYRAVTVKVDDEAGIAGFLYASTIVDVLVVIAPPTGGDQVISKIVLQNIKVLASGSELDQRENGREAEAVKTVTLLVTPEQAEKLTLSSSEGRLRLALRGSTDQQDAATGGANRSSLLAGSRALPLPDPAQAQPRPSPRPATAQPRKSAKSMMVSLDKVLPAPAPAPTPAPPRNTIEIFEGSKKHAVNFP
jgi:pilus assembly protein CpaB